MQQYFKVVSILMGALSMLAVLITPVQAMGWEHASASKSLVISDNANSPNTTAPVLLAQLTDTASAKTDLAKSKLKSDESAQRKSKDNSHSNEVIPASHVPEPQTYAMLLTGLGLLIVTLSRKKGNHFK